MDTTLTQKQKAAIQEQVAACRRAFSTEEKARQFDSLPGWKQACMAFGQPMNKRGCKKVIELASKPKYQASMPYIPGEKLEPETPLQRIKKAIKNIF